MFVSEEYQIVQRIKDYIKNEKPPTDYYIMLRNKRILDIDSYRKMVSRGKINPQDAYVYFDIHWGSSKTSFRYPFLVGFKDLLNVYLSKLGFYYKDLVVPATGLKYIASAIGYRKNLIEEENYLSIEVVNLDIAANNTNLPNVVAEVLDGKLISGERELTEEEYKKIRDMYKSQKLFAGYNFDEAYDITSDYYYEGNQSLAKEVTHIAMDYVGIFQPYTVCYDTNNWKELDCWSIK